MARPKKIYPYAVVVSNELPRQSFTLVAGTMLLPIWPFAVPVFYYAESKRPFLAVVPKSNNQLAAPKP